MCVCYENSQNVNSLVDLLKMHSCQSNQKISSKYVKWLYWIIQVLWFDKSQEMVTICLIGLSRSTKPLLLLSYELCVCEDDICANKKNFWKGWSVNGI